MNARNPSWIKARHALSRRLVIGDDFVLWRGWRVLAEGGYEADRSMVYYMQPNVWAPSIEDAILGKAKSLVGRVRADN